MGFSVRYSRGFRDEVADRLIARPQSSFGKPYAGYLFFLFENVTTADRGHEILEWIEEAKERLDASTGELRNALASPGFRGYELIGTRWLTEQFKCSSDAPYPPRDAAGSTA